MTLVSYLKDPKYHFWAKIFKTNTHKEKKAYLTFVHYLLEHYKGRHKALIQNPIIMSILENNRQIFLIEQLPFIPKLYLELLELIQRKDRDFDDLVTITQQCIFEPKKCPGALHWID
jgi:hypothetical protein